ncbi:Esa1p-associated factor [Xylographa soralifera]|nr:Esa1p-associated factor [Xylographa soralifera]
MAPNTAPTQQAYAKDERVLCFHHELLYEAKVLDSKLSDPSDKKSQMLYRVHYKGWKNTWDDWVSGDRVRKLTDENKELAQNLKKDLDALRKPAPQKITNSKKKNAGSDRSSNRGSEERQSSAPATGRGQKRGRDNEIEKVGSLNFSSLTSSPLSEISSTAGSAFSFEQDEAPVSAVPQDIHPSGTTSRPLYQNTGKYQTRSRWIPGISDLPKAAEDMYPGKYEYERTYREIDIHEEGLITTMLKDLSFREIDYPERKVHKRVLHPALKQSGYNAAKSEFFMCQDPKLRLMIAGVPPESALHPLHTLDSLDPSVSLDITVAHLSLPSPPNETEGNTNAAPTGHDAQDTQDAQDAQDSNNTTFQEESFHSRPHIRIPCPDNLKSLLVDDWENVTKNLLLVPLPSKTPVTLILDTYFDEEKGKRRLGSAEADLLEEVVAGVKEYFDKCLGRILLYRFEREQFFEVRGLWEGAVGGEWEGKGPGDVYGAEHLARLFVSMPELIAQTNMDHQAVNRLREELAKLTQWLGKNASKYFTAEYESATQEYIEKARGV